MDKTEAIKKLCEEKQIRMIDLNQYYSGLPYKSYNVLAQAAGFNSLFISDIPIYSNLNAAYRESVVGSPCLYV